MLKSILYLIPHRILAPSTWSIACIMQDRKRPSCRSSGMALSRIALKRQVKSEEFVDKRAFADAMHT